MYIEMNDQIRSKLIVITYIHKNQFLLLVLEPISHPVLLEIQLLPSGTIYLQSYVALTLYMF